jgi:phosphoribosylamine-glycine ligase
MRFNFISTTGDSLGLALRVLEEQNPVRMWIDEDEALAIGDGMVPKVEDLGELVRGIDGRDDIFVFDTTGNGVIADGLRNQGFPVVGGSILADRLEKDRAYARKVMENSEIATPSSVTFKDWDSAIEFAKTVPDRMVYKPSGHLGDLSPSLVTYDQEDLVELLENLKNRIHVENIEFDLQSFEEGLEISTEGWFQNGAFLPLFNHTFERKQLMAGNLGPSGGCTGNVVWACDGECPVCRAGIKKLARFLQAKGFRGPIDINAIVSEDAYFGLEFTPRFGYDAFPTLAYKLLDIEVGQFLADMAMDSFIPASALHRDTFAAGVKVTIPPWPSEKYNAEPDVPIKGVDKNDRDVYWYNVKASEDRIVSAGAWGIICLTLGSGNTIAGSFRNANALAESLRLQDKQYRIDLSSEFKKSMETLDGLYEHVGRNSSR